MPCLLHTPSVRRYFVPAGTVVYARAAPQQGTLSLAGWQGLALYCWQPSANPHCPNHNHPADGWTYRARARLAQPVDMLEDEFCRSSDATREVLCAYQLLDISDLDPASMVLEDGDICSAP